MNERCGNPKHETRKPSQVCSFDRADALIRLKCELLTQGLPPSSLEGLPAKSPIRARSGVSGGLDLRLPFDVFVNAPVHEPFCAKSPFRVEWSGLSGRLMRGDASLETIDALPAPSYYARQTADGSESMARIGQMCSPDRFCYGMTGPGCAYWRRDWRCGFCSIGANYNADAARKRADHFLEVLEAALSEEHYPARHVLLGGGTPLGDDMGARLASDLCRKLKLRFPSLPVYVMIAAPQDDHFIDQLAEAGVDELGLNLEFWSEDAWARYIPGKREVIGKERTLAALEYSVRVFGPVRTRTIFVAGLEPLGQTIAGVDAVSSLGVMPILSPFRPLAGTLLADTSGPPADEYADLFWQSRSITERHGVPLGPTCVFCQNNTLALPFGPEYRRY